ncbi:MAG: DUF262 domain-containing protein [Bacteroidales bacterium]|nr:DUF262 domain-containing protein [Bacteroidales bacterium]MBR6160865.1 DUF262 domain-containing protein [Bacteroidales bacterium]
MSNNTKAISFWNFLKESTIEIPIIQRDYAQGRLGKENLRKTFLADLKKALDNEHPYKDTPMKLDFVYGSAENGKLNPLDGQQRLTTLWLLHWYIALRAGELSEDGCKIFRKFTYETRISSREFCQNLCVPEYFKDFDGKDIVGFIAKQTWLYSAWKQDPTIQSMLRMLGGTRISDKKGEDIVDGIEEIFQETNEDGFKSYWEKLTQKETIVFYHLPLKDFGLSDDLYIKMNARGKQLTSFENFKADLIGYITKQAEDNPESEWKNLLDAENGIPIKLDTDWTDIFWKNKSKESKIDEIYFAFINRYFLQELICAKKEDKTDFYSADNLEKENVAFRHLYGEKSDDSRLQYSGLDKYLFSDGKAIPLNFFTSLSETFNNLKPNLFGCKFFGGCCINNYFPTWVDSKFEFIPQYDETGNITTLGQKERVVFLAICMYFEKDSFDETSFKQWIRVVWNIVENSGIETISAMIGAMRLIDGLSEGAHDIYNFLSNSQLQVKSNFAKEQVAEEIAKAKQILYGAPRSDGKSWEEIIIEAEKYAFFKGSIRFLFTDGEGYINWCDFDKKWTNVKKYFDKDGEIVEEYKTNAILLRALLSRINIGENWFGYYREFWYTSLLKNDYQSAIHYLLTTLQLDIDNTCPHDWITHDSLLQKLLCCYNSWHILTNWNNYDVLTRYSQRRSDATSHNEIVVLNDLRNRLLAHKDIVISQVKKVEGTTYLYGLNINFSYNNHFFQWYGSSNDIELDIYLMENDWADYKKRPNPTFDKNTDEDKYYCFKVDAAATPDSFIKELDSLIKQAESDLS